MTAGRLRSLPPPPDVDIRQIIQEAQIRWLRPVEVCEILRNYKLHNFKLNPVPASTPPSGSLFLFDRKALRYFRKDGHNWRKKKDGKTVREAHERLKAGSIDVLHCYYAHGEDNPNFQRRAYWMLDVAYEHIVLVHYREVTENNRSCILRNVLEYGAEKASSVPLYPHPSHYPQSSASSLSIGASMASPDTVDMPGSLHSPEPEDVESADADEIEDVVGEDGGDHSGLQSSLLDQLGDGSQVPGPPHQIDLKSWHSGLRSTSSFLGAEMQVNSSSFHPRESNKSPFSQMQNLSEQFPPPRPSFSHSESANSIRRQISDILDSPGLAYNSLSHQELQASNSSDISRWSSLLENGQGNVGLSNAAGGSGKLGLNSPWEDMLATVTTPGTRNRLLEREGLQSNLGQSPLGRDPSHAIRAPISPKGKGIADALSPRNLGRVPQSALEADLRDVTEKNVLKEAEDKVQQRNRWQTSPSEFTMLDATNQRILAQSGAQQINAISFGEPDTLNALVRSGQFQQDSENLWSTHQQFAPVQNSNQYEKSNLAQLLLQSQDQKLLVSPPPQNNSGFFDNTVMLSPSTENFLKDVRGEEGSLDVMENYKKLGSFGKLDSFGRWMNSTDDISDIHPMASSSGSLWDSGYQEDALSAVPQHMDEGLSLSPSLSEQLFNIVDFSPEWGSTIEETKVIISGSFMKAPTYSDQRWCCMFGAIEVPAEILSQGSLRCKAPPQDAESVPFYVTCGDRQACSQVRSFEYRSPLRHLSEPRFSSENLLGVETKEEMILKIRLSRMLLGHACALNNGRNGNKTQTFEERDDDQWRSLENMVQAAERPLSDIKEQLLEVILSHKLQEWLQVKSKLQMEDGRGPRVLDDRGQGVPHFMGALGYVWSVGQLYHAGGDVPINFRDSSGWTALHWAAKFGREKMVVALLEAGAAAILISDPTHRCPRGERAADLASAGGHGGIAAFLANKTLTERLSGLTLDDGLLNEIDKTSADIEGENAVAQLRRRTSITRTVHKPEDQEKLRTSLEAVRASTQAAALIQSVFRQHSFRRRAQVDLTNIDEYGGLTAAEMHSFLAARKIQQAFRGHHQKKMNHAATRIQQKYRGWKGRRDFQTIRQRIIRLQAHVRGRLVRNHFKKIIWSVSIVEKLVLRWLRKRTGLRGFNPSRNLEQSVDGNEDLIKEGIKMQKEAIEEEKQKVESMARQKSDREQYTRLVEEERRTSAPKGELNDFVTSQVDFME